MWNETDLEEHHSYRLSGQCIPDDKFRDYIERDLLVRDSLDDTDGNDVYECYALCQEQSQRLSHWLLTNK